MSEVQKRRFTRINYSREVVLNFQGRSYCPCRIKDLSLSGMYVFSRFAESKGTYCQVFLRQVGPGSDLTIKAAARVVREDKDGMAIEFTSMAFDSYMSLQVILLYEAEDPFFIGLEYPENCPFELYGNAPDFRGQSELHP
ncbi:MAG: PilZ domain-containing protein [Desulfobulbaceae bacterium]